MAGNLLWDRNSPALWQEISYGIGTHQPAQPGGRKSLEILPDCKELLAAHVEADQLVGGRLLHNLLEKKRQICDFYFLKQIVKAAAKARLSRFIIW